jgi:hypothetical protein
LALVSDTPTISPVAWGLFGGGIAARVALHFLHRNEGGRLDFSDLWLLPICDILIAWVWLRSLFTSRVGWRNDEFDIGADGVLRPLP